MSIAPISASQLSYLDVSNLHPLEIAFRETVRSLETALEHFSLEGIQEHSQKLQMIADQMRIEKLPYTMKYQGQAIRLSEQVEKVLSASVMPAYTEAHAGDAEATFHAINALFDKKEQCKRWLELAKNAENPKTILDKIEDGMVRTFTAVQLAYQMPVERKAQIISILKNDINFPISTEFFEQAFAQMPQQQVEFPIHPGKAVTFANHLIQIKRTNSTIYQDFSKVMANPDTKLLLNSRGIYLNTLLIQIPHLAKLYMDDLRTHQKEKCLEDALQTLYEAVFANLTLYFNTACPDENVFFIRATIRELQKWHFIRLPIQENYLDRLPPRLLKLIQKKYFGEIPQIEFSALPKMLETPLVELQKIPVPLTPFLCSRDLGNMAGVQHIWKRALQHLVLPRFHHEVEHEMEYFPKHQTQLNIMGCAATTSLDSLSFRYLPLSSYGPPLVRPAIKRAFREAVKNRLAQERCKRVILTHVAYPALPLQHSRLIENFYFMPVRTEASSLANYITFIKTVVKDDQELACEIANAEPKAVQLVLWEALIEETQDAPFILSLIQDAEVQAEVAKQINQ